MADPRINVRAANTVGGEELVDVVTDLLAHERGHVWRQNDRETGAADVPPHGAFGLGVEDAPRSEDPRAGEPEPSGTLGADANNRCCPICEQSAGDEIRRRSIPLLKSEGAEL